MGAGQSKGPRQEAEPANQGLSARSGRNHEPKEPGVCRDVR